MYNSIPENNMTKNGYSAYTTTQNQSGDQRDMEYRLLAQVTSAMVYARDNPKDYKARISSAIKNRDVWAALRLDLNNENNQLPRELRASLVSLSLWIERESAQVVDGDGDIDAMIEVNRNIMAGLKPDDEKKDDEKAVDTSPQPSSELA